MKILQIATAPPGLRAIFRAVDGGESEMPVVCFGLVKDANGRQVIPLACDANGTIENPADQKNFVGIIGPVESEVKYGRED